MKVYAVYEWGYDGFCQTDRYLKVYKNEEDANNFCKKQPRSFCYGVSYVELDYIEDASEEKVDSDE